MNVSTQDFATVPVVLFCGGRGVVVHSGTLLPCNKALVQVRGKPLLWWVMCHYVQHGARDFVLATGIQCEQFEPALHALGGQVSAQDPQQLAIDVLGQPCNVRLVPTGEQASTAQRLIACKPWVKHASSFAVTYSDTISDVNLSAELAFHFSANRIATLVAAKFPVRFRVLGIRSGESLVRAFASRPVIEAASINGGYYLFTQEIWHDRFGLAQADALENTPLERLAQAGQLTAFSHSGVWQNCDSGRDLECIERIIQSGALAVG